MMKWFLGSLLAATVCCGEDVRGTLLKGVEAINCEGMPGGILCGGEKAHPLVVGKNDRSFYCVAAAAEYGKGRVVAVSHPSFFSSWPRGGCNNPDTFTFACNAADWISQGKKPVLVFNNAELLATLKRMENVSASELKDWGQLTKDVAFLAVDPEGLPAQEVERVRAYITGGGGLLATSIGWGWHQVTGGKSFVTESLFNRLLGPAGLLVNGLCVFRTEEGGRGYLANSPVPPCVSISDAAAYALKPYADKAKAIQANATLCAAKHVLADDDKGMLAQHLDAVIRTADLKRVPTEKEPMREDDIASRLALISLCNAWQANPRQQWKASPAAAGYPGVVGKNVMRGRKVVDINLDVPNWHSTGLFASAGDAVTVELPAGAEKLGLKLRFGSSSCDVLAHEGWARVPKACAEIPLTQLRSTLSTPFGGLVYVVVPEKVEAQKRICKVTFGNVCPAPWFKAGRDKPADWKQIQKCPAPYAELEGSRIIITLPTAAVQDLKDPTAILKFWDDVADLYSSLTGLPKERRYAERFVFDPQICTGWMHAGYPVMLPMPIVSEVLDREGLLKGSWGFFHELGHNYQNLDWTFGDYDEGTVNIFTLYAHEKICGVKPRETPMRWMEHVHFNDWLGRGKPYGEWCDNPFLKLELFVRIQEAYGWEAYEKLFAEYRGLSDHQRPKTDEERRDQWCIRLSKITGDNIASLFASWSIPVSETARRICADFPEPKKWLFAN